MTVKNAKIIMPVLVMAFVMPAVGATSYITEEYLIREYDRIFPNTDVDREEKVEVMNNILNTVPVEIPVNEKRDEMIEKIALLIEKKHLRLDEKDMRAAESIDQQINREKLAMAKLGLTLHEDTFRGNEWYERAVEYSTRNAHLVPEQSKKFMVVPEADASGESWRVFHTTTHSCNPLSCTNTWQERIHDNQYSHLSVVLDTVASQIL